MKKRKVISCLCMMATILIILAGCNDRNVSQSDQNNDNIAIQNEKVIVTKGVKFGVAYNPTKKQVVNELSKLPANHQVYAVFTNDSSFNCKSIGLTIYKIEENNINIVTGTSVLVDETDNVAAIPITIINPGKYKLVFKSSDNIVLYEVTADVV